MFSLRPTESTTAPKVTLEAVIGLSPASHVVEGRDLYAATRMQAVSWLSSIRRTLAISINVVRPSLIIRTFPADASR